MRQIPDMYARLILVLFLFLATLTSATFVSAATFRSSENYILEREATLEDNLYAMGGTLHIDGTVAGDLLVAGGEVVVSGPVGEDAMIAGGRVTIRADVGGDVRVVGGEATLAGSVAGDAVFAGGTVRVNADTVIAGDLVAVADVLVVDGTVKGDLIGHVRVLTINGHIEGGTSLVVRESVALTDTASIGGDFSYRAPREAVWSERATVGGATRYDPLPVRTKGTSGLVASFIFTLLVVLVPALALFYFIPRYLNAISERVLKGNGFLLLWGVVSLFAIPVLALVLVVTIVGVLPGVVLLMLYGVLLAVARVLSPIVAGAILVVWFMRTPVSSMRMYHVVLGFIALELISFVPVLGFFTTALIYLALLGALVRLMLEVARAYLRTGKHVADEATIPIAFAPPPETFIHDYENEPRGER